MILTSHVTWVRVANYYEEEDEDPSGTFIEIRVDSYGSHGFRGGPERPAGPAIKGHANWTFDTYNYPKPGSKFSIWVGQEGGSYHERWVKLFATVGKEPPKPPHEGYRRKEGPPKFAGTFVFSDIMDCCKKIIELTGCLPPEPWELSEAIPPKQGSDPDVKPDKANKPRPGETSEQYWKRITKEQLGQFPYKHEGD